MTDFTTDRDEQRPHSPPTSPDDLLPPVEPPSAGFIIQLFVVPALIVLAIVLLWLSFNWLVRRTSSDPRELIEGLDQGPPIARWQRASELADMLRNKRYEEFKRSSDSADRLAKILDREIDAASMEQSDVEFRNFLTRALGHFEVQDGIDVLLKAADTNRDEREQKVRDGALQAIAQRIYNLQHLDPPQQLAHPELESTLLRLAETDDAAIRFQTAYVLGQLGTPAAVGRLEVMAGDSDVDTRFNAAIALAHRGNAAAVETLAEMLDLEELERERETAEGERPPTDRRVFVHTAMEASKTLVRENPSVDMSPVVEALQRLVDADASELDAAQLPAPVVAEAKRTLKVLQDADAIREAK